MPAYGFCDALFLILALGCFDFDDLKSKLLGVVVVVLGVQFLAQVLSWDGKTDLLSFGAAVAVVILALAFFISQKKKPSANHKDD